MLQCSSAPRPPWGHHHLPVPGLWVLQIHPPGMVSSRRAVGGCTGHQE